MTTTPGPGAAGRPGRASAAHPGAQRAAAARQDPPVGLCSRADLARLSGLSKPTVSLAMSNGRTVRPDPDRRPPHRGARPRRPAVRDPAGRRLRARPGHRPAVPARRAGRPEPARSAPGCPASPGVQRAAAGSPSWSACPTRCARKWPCRAPRSPRPSSAAPGCTTRGWASSPSPAGCPAGQARGADGLRAAFGPYLVVENDADAAALAEQAFGHGREVDSFAFVSVGTGIGMGLVLGGRLHRGFHGVAGEIAYLPISEGPGPTRGTRGAGVLEAAGRRRPWSARPGGRACAARCPRAGCSRPRRPGTPGPRRWWRGGPAGGQGVCAVVTVVDPPRGARRRHRPGPGLRRHGIRRAARHAPVVPDIRVSARGSDAVVHGCMAAGADLAWQRLLAALPASAPDLPAPDGASPASAVRASAVPEGAIPAGADGCHRPAATRASRGPRPASKWRCWMRPASRCGRPARFGPGQGGDLSRYLAGLGQGRRWLPWWTAPTACSDGWLRPPGCRSTAPTRGCCPAGPCSARSRPVPWPRRPGVTWPR